MTLHERRCLFLFQTAMPHNETDKSYACVEAGGKLALEKLIQLNDCFCSRALQDMNHERVLIELCV